MESRFQKLDIEFFVIFLVFGTLALARLSESRELVDGAHMIMDLSASLRMV